MKFLEATRWQALFPSHPKGPCTYYHTVLRPFLRKSFATLSPAPTYVSTSSSQGGVFYGLERYPWESGQMLLLVGLAKLLAIACTVQAGFRVSHPHSPPVV